jgi:cathepsin L
MKAATLLLLIVGAVLAAAYTETEYKDAFASWIQEHQKTYAASEFRTRYAVFKSNMDYVRDWNAGNSDTILGMTRFADLTNEEYRKIYLGTPIDGTARLAQAEADRAANPPKVARSDVYNSTTDWRAKGAVTAIKNQGDCGSCWSFSTTGSTEGAHFLSGQTLVSLSEQNLMDCSSHYGNDGCDGGTMDNAFQYIIANNGIDTEDSYPYQGVQNTKCLFNPDNVGATLSSYKDIPSGSESDLTTAAATIGPISVAIDAGQPSFQLYKGGVYHDYLCSSTKLDHGVLVVGLGSEKTLLDTKDYYIVKNSWGTTWGLEGYIYMSRNRDNNCGIATAASYPIV